MKRCAIKTETCKDPAAEGSDYCRFHDLIVTGALVRDSGRDPIRVAAERDNLQLRVAKLERLMCTALIYLDEQAKAGNKMAQADAKKIRKELK